MAAGGAGRPECSDALLLSGDAAAQRCRPVRSSGRESAIELGDQVLADKQGGSRGGRGALLTCRQRAVDEHQRMGRSTGAINDRFRLIDLIGAPCIVGSRSTWRLDG